MVKGVKHGWYVAGEGNEIGSTNTKVLDPERDFFNFSFIVAVTTFNF